MDDEEYEFVAIKQPRISRRFRKMDLVMLGLQFAHDVATSVADALHDATMLVAADSNYRVDQQAFHEDAAREIESLIAGEEE